jgi:beta-1,4-N-acetylglucosaminyltransferase
MFVMGSGGHTAEMLSMIERSISPSGFMVRRYVVSAGDVMSRTLLLAMEERLSRSFQATGKELGAFDIVEVPRARLVHQSWLTTPLTALQSIFGVSQVLLQGNTHIPGYKLPGVVVTNGPGTGFIVVAVAHLLRMMSLVPIDRLKTVYVESFAKVRTLSLTGKLLHYFDIVDVFVVQHEPLHQRYGHTLQQYFSVTPAVPLVSSEAILE